MFVTEAILNSGGCDYGITQNFRLASSILQLTRFLRIIRIWQELSKNVCRLFGLKYYFLTGHPWLRNKLSSAWQSCCDAGNVYLLASNAMLNSHVFTIHVLINTETCMHLKHQKMSWYPVKSLYFDLNALTWASASLLYDIKCFEPASRGSVPATGRFMPSLPAINQLNIYKLTASYSILLYFLWRFI